MYIYIYTFICTYIRHRAARHEVVCSNALAFEPQSLFRLFRNFEISLIPEGPRAKGQGSRAKGQGPSPKGLRGSVL